MGNLSGTLTVGVFLEVRELFWREFALCFSHSFGGGGCRVQKPFDSTAQSQYTPVRHAPLSVTHLQSVTGYGFVVGWMIGSSMIEINEESGSLASVQRHRDDSRYVVDNNNKRGRPELRPVRSSLHYELIPPITTIPNSSSSSTTNMCYVHGSIDQVTSVCPMCKVFKPSGARYSVAFPGMQPPRHHSPPTVTQVPSHKRRL